MTVSEATVDVLVPVYNAVTFVRSSIESIQKQSLSNIRILVVDDGSTDGSSAILAAMAAEDPRICILTKPNGGIVDALNWGLESCRAEFVARHDADDIAYSTRLEQQVAFLRAHSDVVAVAGRARHIGTDGVFLGKIASFRDPSEADPAYLPAQEPYLLHPFLMVRRAALARVRGYRHVIHAEDADLYWRLQEIGRLHNMEAIQGEYRIHQESISSRSIENARVMAVSSQLCAISATRRAAGSRDLSFTRSEGLALKAASKSLAGACAVIQEQLTSGELRHLHFAAGMKLLELADYRPYEVEMSDCVLLRRALKESVATLRGRNGVFVARAYSGTAARLAAAGKWREARLLITWPTTFPFIVRLLLRVALPPVAHRAVKGMFRKMSVPSSHALPAS